VRLAQRKVEKILKGTIQETDNPVVIDDDSAVSDSTKKLHQCQGAIFGQKAQITTNKT
jgi:hypothetical protein